MLEIDPLLLAALQRTYFLARIEAACPPPGLHALVLDRTTHAAVNACVPKETLLRTVAAVELLDEPRRVQRYLLAVYLVEPLVHNLACLQADAESERYAQGTALFIPLLQWDTASAARLPKVLNAPVVSRYLDSRISFVHALMVPVESRVFLAGASTPSSMPLYYAPSCTELVLPQVRRAAKAIVNCVVVAGEYPLIRFLARPGASHPAARLPELLADEVQRQLDDYARHDAAFPPPQAPDKPRAVLVICDRSIDVWAPLVHEFTYQAMAMDVIKDLDYKGVYTYEAETEAGGRQRMEARLEHAAASPGAGVYMGEQGVSRAANLGVKANASAPKSSDGPSSMQESLTPVGDPTWTLLRHAHIIDASQAIVSRINDLIRNNPLMVDRLKAKSSADLMYVVAHLQGFDDERREATLHKSLIDECLAINADQRIAEYAADFEQACAAKGIFADGSHAKLLHEDLVTLLAREDLSIDDKTRLVLVYALYRGGLTASDFKKLGAFIDEVARPGLRGISLPDPRSSFGRSIGTRGAPAINRCAASLSKLGATVIKDSPKTKPVSPKVFHSINDDAYNTSRFVPALKSVLGAAAKYELDEECFPYFRDKPLEDDAPNRSANDSTGSLRNPRIKASWAPQSSRSLLLGARRQNQRVFCYVAGGLTYSEIRLVYELSDTLHRDFYIGSECIMRPRGFLRALESIDDGQTREELNLPLDAELEWDASPAPAYLLPVKNVTSATSLPASSGANLNGSQSQAMGQSGSQPAMHKKEPEPAKQKKLSRFKKLFK